jgi:glycosyltransferase involved in cell wall biosynthesis
MNKPIITIITVSYNSAATISDTIDSVLSQTYQDIEYIIIDGASSDGTIEIIRSYGSKISRFITEPDRGIYDAINKGIAISTGDIVGIVNSDDVFYDRQVIGKVAESFMENDIDAVYGDAIFVSPENTLRIVRYYSSGAFHPGRFRFGFMPAHPSFYVKRAFFEKLGLYKTDYKIAADFELLLRFLYVNRIRTKYIEMPFVSMRMGGRSNKSPKSNIILNREILRACRENGLKTGYFLIYLKYFFKVFEFVGNTKRHSAFKGS